MAANPMNNKNLGRTHSKELAKNNRGKRTRKNHFPYSMAPAARPRPRARPPRRPPGPPR